jgi:hypothetical protein
MVTISTHIGHDISREHNLRDPAVILKEKHIDPQGEHETWIDKPLRQAYEEIFGEAVKKYNSGKRSDRQIKDYYQKIKKDKQKHLAYELIVGVYNTPDENGTYPDYVEPDKAKSILRQYLADFAERNPNLIVTGAYYHNDEQGQPHAHIDFIPVAYNCTRGLSVQTSQTAALNQLGFCDNGKKNTAWNQWREAENKHLESICHDFGVREISHPMSGKSNVEHVKTDLYKAKAERDEAIKQAQELLQINAELQRQNGFILTNKDTIKTAINKAKNKNGLVELPEQDFRDLTLTSQYWEQNYEQIKQKAFFDEKQQLEAQKAELQQKERDLHEREIMLQKKLSLDEQIELQRLRASDARHKAILDSNQSLKRQYEQEGQRLDAQTRSRSRGIRR